MLSATQRRVGDGLLVALLAFVPAAAIGLLALHALGNEEAAVRDAEGLLLQSAADRVEREIAAGVREAARRLASAEAGALASPRALRALAPAFAEPVVLAPNGTLEWPAPARLPAAAAAPEACRGLAETLSHPRRPAAEREHARAAILARCQEARTPQGRFLWPVVALDGRAPVEARALVAWLRQHADALGASERAVTIERIHTAPMPAAARAEARAAAGGGGSPRAELVEALAEPAVAQAGVAPGAPGAEPPAATIGWDAAGAIGRVRRLADGRFAGFVAHAGSLRAAIAAGRVRAIASPASAVVVGRGTDPPRAATDVRTAVAELAPDLRVFLLSRDPATLGRIASRRRLVLGALAAAAALLVLGVGVFTGARLRRERRTSQLRTDFVSAVSHELRTPIASVRLLAEMLEQGRLEPADLDEAYATLAGEARKLGQTVDRLLGFGRLQSGRATLAAVEGAVADAVAPCLDAFESRHPELPALVRTLDRDARAAIDGAQLAMAVENLLENARKHAPAGAPYRVSVARAQGRVCIAVSDDGPGIAARDQRRIFEPFERADDRLSTATDGAGVGLALVRHVARAHGGEVGVQSAPGRGATFTIWVPEAGR